MGSQYEIVWTRDWDCDDDEERWECSTPKLVGSVYGNNFGWSACISAPGDWVGYSSDFDTKDEAFDWAYARIEAGVGR